MIREYFVGLKPNEDDPLLEEIELKTEPMMDLERAIWTYMGFFSRGAYREVKFYERTNDCTREVSLGEIRYLTKQIGDDGKDRMRQLDLF